jgi:predicted Zn-dependent protease
MLDEQTCREVIELAMREMEGDQAHAFLTTTARTRVEFCEDQVGPALRVEEKALTVWVSRARCVGRATNNDLAGRSIKQLAVLAGDLARAATEDPDFAPAVEPQHYAAIPAYDDATDAFEPAAQVDLVERVRSRVSEKSLRGSGWLEVQSQDFAVGNSRGNFGFHRGTSAELSVVAASADGGEGCASASAVRVADLDPSAVADRACAAARALRSLASGRYAVTFAPSCVAALLAPFLEGFGRLHGGERVLGDALSLASDAAHPLVLAPPFDETGAARERCVWIDHGKLVSACRARPGALVLDVDAAGSGTRPTPARSLLVTRLLEVRRPDSCSGIIAGVAGGVLVLEQGEVVARAPDFFFEHAPTQWLGARASGLARVWSPDGGALAVPALEIEPQAVVFARES